MKNHLNHEQLCDLLLTSRSGSLPVVSIEIENSREHVRDCHLCAAELSTLDQSLLLFRSTADAWANHEWHSHHSLLQSRNMKPASTGLLAFLARPVIWASAAAIALFAAALPVTLHYLPGAKTNAPTAVAIQTTNTTQSDEALLEEIDQTLSSTVPTPMQPLADPTTGQSNTQRKN
ncbi:MAG: hypothetical protein JSS95_13745 [Acidobacteria bacterium]|nr:hypothetical protein [Acidobacteriota bacterium]